MTHFKIDQFIVPDVITEQLTGVLEPNAVFEGTLAYSGCFHVNGTLRGKVNTPDVLVVGESGKIEGQIQAGIVIIYGKVEAEINAKYRVEIRKPAIFKGEMSTPSLKVEEGVIFEGTNKMR